MTRFFGVGRTFKNGKGGIPARLENKELVRDSLFQIFNTRKGERVMRPNFGTTFWDLVFSSQGPVLKSLIRREVQRGFQFEPRASLIEVIQREEDTKVIVDIIYSVDGKEEKLTIESERP